MRAAWIVPVIGLLVACGQDGVTIDTSASNFCEQIADVACNNMYQCCTEGEIESRLHVTEPRTEDQCRTDYKRNCDRQSAQVNDSIKAGRVKFDSANLNKCLEAIVAPGDTCSDVVTTAPWIDACKDTAFVGTVATDGACLFAGDCAGGVDSYCAPNQKCTAKPTGGFPCGNNGCASAFFCQTGICQAKLNVGAMCMSTTQCATDLFCDTSLTTPVCAAKEAGGATCSSSAACLSATCIPGTCMGTSNSCFKDTDCGGRCGGTGFTCTASSQCSSGTCQIGGNSCSSDLSCTTTGDHCVFPILCVPGTCVGTPVCTAQTTTIDFCTGALGQLPIP